MMTTLATLFKPIIAKIMIEHANVAKDIMFVIPSLLAKNPGDSRPKKLAPFMMTS